MVSGEPFPAVLREAIKGGGCGGYGKGYTGMLADIDQEKLKEQIKGNTDPKEIKQYMQLLSRFVPYRFIPPWLVAELRGMPDQNKDKTSLHPHGANPNRQDKIISRLKYHKPSAHYHA